MPTDQNLIDDVMTLGGNILGNLLGARGELKAQARQRVEMLARRLDLVSREEFEAAFAMIAKARTMQEDLSERLTAVERKLNLSSAKKTGRTMKANLPSLKHAHRRRGRM